MDIRLIVFDLAGTTVKDNKDVHRSLQQALLKHGVGITIEEANAVMGIPKPVAISQLLSNHNVKFNDQTIASIHTDFVKEMILFYSKDPSVSEIDGVSDLFKILRGKGIKVGVDTGFDRDITNTLLARLRWTKKQLIDCSVTSDEVSRGRPYPDMIFEAMKRTGISDVKNVAKVGDTISDIEEGKSAGCAIVAGVTTGAFSAEALTPAHPTHLIDRISQVLDIIE